MSINNLQHFDRPVTEIIRKRRSVRTYKPEAISGQVKEKLTAYAAQIQGPFAVPLRLVLIDNDSLTKDSGGKIGTYGVIRGASSYIAAAVENKDRGMEELGYCLEKLVLYAESLGLGTCWLGGTFKRSQFAELIGLKAEELLPIVTPIGHPAEKKAVVESLMRKVAGSDHRKPWEELFFHEGFDKALSKNEAGIIADALEMVRLAPSASNKQPWRILKQGNSYHFYLQHAKGYGSAMGFDMQKIDMGIAMCHFEMTLAEAGVRGDWVAETQVPQAKADTEYIISWAMV